MARVIAAFDFDGTLTTRDSIIQFISYSCGKKRLYCAIFKAIPALLKTILGLASRQQAKEALLGELFKGIPKQRLIESGTAFARGDLQLLLKPQMMEKVRWHQKQEHECVLVSANLDVYLEPWGAQEGFKAVLCSRLAVDQNGCATGKLEGLNCWGPEKLHRLLAWLEGTPRSDYTLYAYGDSRGDYDLLAAADKGFYC